MIQKIVTSFREDQRTFLFTKIINNFQEIATDKQGLCVIKKLIENTKNP